MTELSRTHRKAQAARAAQAVRDHYTGPASVPDLLARAQAAAPDLPLSEGWLRAQLLRIDQEQPALRVVSRTPEQWAALFPRYPIDSDGFARPLPAHAPEAVRASLDTYGMAIVTVFSAAECAASVTAMFEEINSLRPAGRPAIHPDRPETWHARNWPSRSKFLLRRPALHPVAFANRTHPAIYELFSTLWGEERLAVTVDNWGIARGTRGMSFPQDDGTVSIEDRPRWHQEIKPHWDYNPWLFVDEVTGGREPGWQGLIALVDQTIEGGCHRTLPGGAPFLARWCAERVCPDSLGRKRASHRPAADDPIRDWMQDIPLRAGTMVLWSWGQLHASVPSRGPGLRLHQYVRMFPAESVDPFYTHHDRYAASRILPEHPGALRGLSLTSTAKRLLGVSGW